MHYCRILMWVKYASMREKYETCIIAVVCCERNIIDMDKIYFDAG